MKIKLIRQDRLKGSAELLLRIDNKTYEIFDYSQTGVSILSEAAFGKTLDAEICLNDMPIAPVKLKWVRNEGDKGEQKVCFVCENCIVPVHKISASFSAYRLYSETESKIHETAEIPESFRLKVYQLKSFLSKMEKSINDSLRINSQTVSAYQYEYEDSFIQCLASNLTNKLFDLVDCLEGLTKKENDPVYLCSLKFFRDEMSKLYDSNVANRFLNKPLGYAGDFEMMNLIYHEHSRANGPMQRIFDMICTNHPHAKSVRNRVHYLNEKIKKKMAESDRPIRVLSVASGPAEEIKHFVKESDQSSLDRVKFVLLDQDAQSLQYAQMNILNVARDLGKNVELELVNLGIKHIAKGKMESRFDLIYSSGLFDYLSDDFARHTASKLFELLEEGGRLAIGNFDYNGRNKISMSLLFNWELIYRSKDDLINLFKSVSPSLYIESEKLGINLFAIMEKSK